MPFGSPDVKLWLVCLMACMPYGLYALWLVCLVACMPDGLYAFQIRLAPEAGHKFSTFLYPWRAAVTGADGKRMSAKTPGIGDGRRKQVDGNGMRMREMIGRKMIGVTLGRRRSLGVGMTAVKAKKAVSREGQDGREGREDGRRGCGRGGGRGGPAGRGVPVKGPAGRGEGQGGGDGKKKKRKNRPLGPPEPAETEKSSGSRLRELNSQDRREIRMWREDKHKRELLEEENRRMRTTSRCWRAKSGYLRRGWHGWMGSTPRGADRTATKSPRSCSTSRTAQLSPKLKLSHACNICI